MKNTQKAAEAIWLWLGSNEYADLVESDLSECDHTPPQRSSDEIDAIAQDHIADIIERYCA